MESGLDAPDYQEPSTSRSDTRPAPGNKKRRNNSGKFKAVHFRNSILSTKRVLSPKAKLNPLTLKGIDSFLSHVIETFDKDLQRLRKIRKVKTLSIKDLETVTKLCLPKLLADSALEYGRRALEMYNSSGDKLDAKGEEI